MITNIDILMPVYIDHPDRLRNLQIAVNYLTKLGISNIYVNEHYKNAPKALDVVPNYINKDITADTFYNKMECGNELFRKFSKNPYIALYDIDVLIPKKDLKQTLELFEAGYDFVYPYNGWFYDIPLTKVQQLQNDLTSLIDINECTLFCKTSHGGCVIFKREVFVEGGMLNPNFKNVGFDDDEINVRFMKLGYKKGRTSSPLLHMTHHRGETTYNHNPYNNHNGNEVGKIDRMSMEQLKQYIKNNYVES
jgi:hypothetical protein